MSARTGATRAGAVPEDADQRVVIHGVPWRTYIAIRELLDSRGLRMSYLEGTLELMTPSTRHELRSKIISRFLELFTLERDLPLNGYGTSTFRSEARRCGLEPDECYVLGGELRELPDLALEVIVTSGGLDKLPIYAGLGVREVWFFQDDSFRLFKLVGGAYQSIAASELVPGLDLEVLLRFATRPDQHQAIREYRDLVRAG